MKRIGTPTDRAQWDMRRPRSTRTTARQQRDRVSGRDLAAAVLHATADDAVNYGAVGAVIGHEMTHGFDDQGRQYDEKGNLVDWQTPADAAKFAQRAQCIVDEFNALEPIPGVHENGQLVQGEAIADLGGTTIAYKAFERTAQFKAHKKIDGYTPEQRFFLAYAQVWRC